MLGLNKKQTDARLVQSVQSDNRSAYDTLMRRYKTRVYGVALSMVGNFDDAETIAHEAFVRAYLNIESLQDPNHFGAWVCGICRNTALSYLRRESRTESLDHLTEAAPQTVEATVPVWQTESKTPDIHLGQSEFQTQIQNALNHLPKKSREVTVLFYLEDRPYKEVADFLGIPESTVQSRLQTARNRLRNNKEILSMAREHTLSDDFESRVNTIIDAVEKADLSKVKTLVEQDKRLVNAKNGTGNLIKTAAHLVVWHRPESREIVQYLADNGANYDIFTASRAGLLEPVRQMLDDNPDLINTRDQRNYTPLQNASLIYGACEEAEEVMDYLLSKGAEIDIFTASHYGMRATVQDILEYDPSQATATDADGLTALHWVSRRRRGTKEGFIKITELLIQNDANVNARDEACGGWTPLHTLAEWPGFTEQVDLILAAGGDINLQDDRGWTPLDYAIDRKRKEIVEYLRTKSANTCVK